MVNRKVISNADDLTEAIKTGDDYSDNEHVPVGVLDTITGALIMIYPNKPLKETKSIY